MNTEEPYLFMERVHDLEFAMGAGDISASMCQVSKCLDHLRDITLELIERGAQAGMTQRKMALMLDIPESALRGARKEFSR